MTSGHGRGFCFGRLKGIGGLEGHFMADGRKADFEATVSISPAHAGALAARMLILEEDCREIERNLDGFQGIFYEYAGEIPETSKERIRAILLEVLDRVTRIRSDLGLPKQIVELDKLIESRLSHMWVTLHESKSHGLRGYGAVPEGLKVYLDPRMDGILLLLIRLREALGKARMEGNPEKASNEVL
jgi:hypothetical protein